MIRLTTFGGLSVRHPDRPLGGATAQPRRLALLAVLARAGSRGVSRDRLVSLFWPDEDIEKARKSLAQAIYALRRDLGDEQVIGGTQELRLDPDLIGSDIGEFNAHVKGGRLPEAAALYTGAFLKDFHLVGAPAFERWADEERLAVQSDYARVLERLALTAERAGGLAEAAQRWKSLAAMDPLDARVTVKLMQALDAIGDAASALKQARIYEALTAQELELPPDREVVKLAATIRERTTAGAASPITPAPAPAPTELVAVVEAQPVSPPIEPPLVEPPTIEPPPVEPQPVEPPPVEPLQLAPPQEAPPPTAPKLPPASSPRRVVIRGVAAGVLLTLGVALAAGMWRGRSGPTLALGATRHLTIDEGVELDPAVSPDGKLVAYVAADSGAAHVFVRQLEGSRAIVVSADVPGDHRRPRWSPDGSRLLFQSPGAIWVVPALGGTPTRLVDGGGPDLRLAHSAEWSPDGRDIVWIALDRILRRPVSGGAPRQIGFVAGGHTLAWSPDGRWISVVAGNGTFLYGSFLRPRSGTAPIGNVAPSSILLIPADSGASRPLVDASALATSAEWLGDGRLVYVSDRFGTRDLFVAEVTRDGGMRGAPRRLTAGIEAHGVGASRDGRVLVYSTLRQESNVWQADLPGGLASARALTRGEQHVEGLTLSPDGTQLAFDSNRSGVQELFIVPIAGGEPRRLTSGANDFQPAWSPDGRRLAFYRVVDGARRLHVVPADGGDATSLGITGASDQRSATWMPDSRGLVFFDWFGDDPQLYRYDGSNRQATPLTTKRGEQPQMSPNGRSVAYLNTPDTVHVLDLEGGEASRRTVLVGGGENPTPISIRWADADHLVIKGFDATGRIGFWSVRGACLTTAVACAAPTLLFGPDPAGTLSARPEFAVGQNRIFFTRTARQGDLWALTIEPE